MIISKTRALKKEGGEGGVGYSDSADTSLYPTDSVSILPQMIYDSSERDFLVTRVIRARNKTYCTLFLVRDQILLVIKEVTGWMFAPIFIHRCDASITSKFDVGRQICLKGSF